MLSLETLRLLAKPNAYRGVTRLTLPIFNLWGRVPDARLNFVLFKQPGGFRGFS